MPMKIDVRFFGEPRILFEGQPLSLTSEQQLTLAVLGAAGPGGISKGLLSEELFDGRLTKSGDQAALMRVRRLASKVKAATGVPVINTGGRCRLDLEHCSVDVWDFLALTKDGTFGALLAAARSWGEPYAGLSNASLVVQASGSDLRRAYRAALTAVGPQLSGAADHDVIGKLEFEAKAAEVDEALTVSAAMALYNAGCQPDALAIISEVLGNLRRAHGLNSKRALARVERAILLNDVCEFAGRPADTQAGLGARRGADAQIFVGRSDVLGSLLSRVGSLRPAKSQTANSQAANSLTSASVVLVEGGGGVGKTALLTQLFERVSNHQVSLRYGTSGPTGAGEPTCNSVFAQAFPQLRGLEGFAKMADEVATAAFFRHVQQLIVAAASTRPQVIVLDNMHAADYQSVLLFRFLARSLSSTSVVMIATARTNEAGAPWSDEVAALREEPGVVHYTLGAFDVEELEALVSAFHPRASVAAKTRFVEYLTRVGGNPLVSTAIVRAADANLHTWVVPESVDPDGAYSEHLERVIKDRRVEQVLAVAALSGEVFSSSQLAQVLAVSPTLVDDRLSQAAAAHVCERLDGDVWRFDHLITVAHFSDRCGLLRPLVFAKLARMGSRDPGQMLRYVTGAGAELAPPERESMLTAAARELAAKGLVSEALSAWQSLLAEEALPDDLVLEASIGAAGILSRLGRHDEAAELRALAVERARSSGRSAMAFEAIVAGLPAAENNGGEAQRLELMDSMTAEERAAVEPGVLARWRLRLARLAGDSAAAKLAAREGLETFNESGSPESDDQLYQEFLCEKWNFEVQQRDCKPMFDKVLALLDHATEPRWRTQLLSNAMVGALNEQRPVEQFLDLYQQATAETMAVASPRTRWCLDVLSATIDQVGIAHTGVSPDDARTSGLRWGISDAVDNWFVQNFVGLWLSGQIGMIQPLMEDPAFGVGLNGAWLAGLALSAASNDDWETARLQAKSAAAAIETRPDDTWTATAAALLAEVAVLLEAPDLVGLVERILHKRSGSAVILGIGSAHLGPADRYLGLAATVTGDGDPAQLFSRAVDQAHTAGATVWEHRALEDGSNFT